MDRCVASRRSLVQRPHTPMFAGRQVLGENVGPAEMVTLFWAGEVFDPGRPDTYYEPVLRGEEGS